LLDNIIHNITSDLNINNFVRNFPQTPSVQPF